MNDLTEIDPKDLIVQHLPPKNAGGWNIGNSTGVRLYHKPSDITIEMDVHRSQHRNKHEALTVLRDLLTEFKEGDVIVYGKDHIGEVVDVEDDGCSYKTEDGVEVYDFFEYIAHTEEGCKYKQRLIILDNIAYFKEKVDELEKRLEVL